MTSQNKTVVLIPHYNNMPGLKKTLSSICHKTGIDVLVIDDGSNLKNKPDAQSINKLVNENICVDFIYLDKNKGITNALNVGLNYISKHGDHEFVARLDCGDTCVANRFKIQEDFLISNPDHSLVGSWVKWVCNETGDEVFNFKPPTEHKKIKKKMSIRCNLIHPSVMYRLATVKELGKYPSNYTAAEDYAYFFKIAKHSKVANIPKYLTSTEHNIKGISITDKKNQNKSKLKIVMKYGKRDFYLLYGIAYNIILMNLPVKWVQKIKMQLR